MPLVAAAIMPHGFSVIPAMDNGVEDVQHLRKAMQRVGTEFADVDVDTLVLVGPHGTRGGRIDGAGSYRTRSGIDQPRGHVR